MKFMSNSPKVSVVIPVRNGGNFIQTAIDSVLNQTFKNLEIIIVDDASIDDTPKICERYEAIKYFRLESNCGSSKARNIGLRMASGDFVAYLDADDYWAPRKIEVQLGILKDKSNLVASICGYLEQNNYGEILSTSQLPVQISNNFFWDSPSVSIGPPSCLLIKMDDRTRDLFWDEDLVGVEDIDFMRRCLKIGEVHFDNTPHVIKRVHDSNLSVQPHYVYFSYNRRALVKMFATERENSKRDIARCLTKFYLMSIKGCLKSRSFVDIFRICKHIPGDATFAITFDRLT